MKILIITVAGMATRFSESIGHECLKCLYYEEDITETLLYRMLSMGQQNVDKYIIVGGFCFNQLEEAIQQEFSEFSDKIVLVENRRFSTYGSGYSLLCGLQKAFELGATDIVFAEGDLYLDQETFRQICNLKESAITCNREAIKASESVAFYYDCEAKIHYIFDTLHGQLVIHEPFTAIYNSGQVWKFSDVQRLGEICSAMSDKEEKGTNLVIVQKYFETMKRKDYKLIRFEHWINCNTIEDFKRIAVLEGKIC
ncbi:hypothetical protein KQI22_13080 [Kineothrix sp. MSJ-39]|uniref:DUF6564 domain-containing protein n=1 Tax=Kineothrix sp. MSJ-39 TaxID=2841533 RepID=UPI001C126F20|nr:DUF6564 domain-containing protein [Kineothrix sp. MSJ-39]MBU5430983.1 hypothetical protein [Kineothrix sp. MSJ-39]